VATANAVKYCDATPVFVDCDPVYLNIDVEKIERAITSRTRAIVTVPLYGHPVDADPIQAIARKHGLRVIEDAAEALGASYRDRPVGSLADCSTFSFFGNKLITTGEGGAIVTDNEQLANRMRFLRGQAVDPNRSYWHPEIGFNYRMTNVAAAIGVAQMERISFLLARRRQVASWYAGRLSSSQELLQLPTSADWADHSYWMYTVLLRPGMGVERDSLMAELEQRGIETRPVFYPVHWLPPYQKYGDNFPVADDCSARGLNLPTHANLRESDVEFVCESLIGSIVQLRNQAAMPKRLAA
jgi:perosamine synthetase